LPSGLEEVIQPQMNGMDTEEKIPGKRNGTGMDRMDGMRMRLGLEL
jgi:hypothetical protein